MNANIHLPITDGKSPDEKSIGPVAKIFLHGEMNKTGHAKMVGSMRWSKAEAVGTIFEQQPDIVNEERIKAGTWPLHEGFENMAAHLVGKRNSDNESYNPGPDLNTKIQ